MSHQLEKDIKEFISQLTSIQIEKITDDKDLDNDLGVAGDDAWELIEEFSEKFNVDLASFEFSKHFTSEGFPPLHENDEYGGYPVTVKHLIEIAEKGIWFEPEFNKEAYDKTIKTRSNLMKLFLAAVIFVMLYIILK